MFTIMLMRYLLPESMVYSIGYFASLSFAYALTFAYRILFPASNLNPSPSQIFSRSLFCGLSGVLLSFSMFGLDCLHTLVALTATYLILFFIKQRFVSLIVSFIFNMGYLLTGYYFMASESYDIDWTTPHCVLTLKLIGLSFDYFDGSRNEKDLSVEEKRFGLKTMPTFLEVFTFSYFFSAYFAGPQFTLYRMRVWLSNDIYTTDKGDKVVQPSFWKDALICFGRGGFYLILFVVLESKFPTSYLKDPEFYSLPLIERLYINWITMFTTLLKYIGVWCFAESPCIILGLAFGGYDKVGKPLWNALSNIKPLEFIFATNHHQIVDTWNVNTNDWLKRYVFKRLRYFDSKDFSAFSALMFLAIWHGFAAGYFISFFMEFVYMQAEVKYQILTRPLTNYLYPQTPTSVQKILGLFYAIFCYGCRSTAFNFALGPFVMKSFWSVVNLMNSLYWYGWVGCFLIFAVFFVFPVKKSKTSEANPPPPIATAPSHPTKKQD